MIGNSLGENKPELAKRYFWMTLGISVVVSWLVILMVFIFRENFAAIYLTKESPLHDLMSYGIMFLCFDFIFDLVQGFLHGPVRGLGLQAQASYINLFCFYFLALPLSYYLAFTCDMSIAGLWLGLATGTFSQIWLYMWIILRADWSEIAGKI